MAKLKQRRPSTPGPVVSIDMPAHEGPRPDWHDTEAYQRWLAIRSARCARDVGGPNDPRLLLMPDVRR